MAQTTLYRKTHPFNVRVYVAMSTNATGPGTDFTTTTTYTQLGDLKMVGLGGIAWAKSNTSHLQSPNAIKESMAGWGEQKPVKFKMYFNETNLDDFLNQATSTGYGVGRQTAAWVFAYPNPTQPTSITAAYYHTAWFEDLDLGEADEGSEDPLTIDVQLQPTGRSIYSSTVT